MHSTTTYEQTNFRLKEIYPKGGERRGFGEAVLNWLARIGEGSAMARQAEAYRRLNALEEAQLARMDMKRTDLLDRCFGWRAYY
jgi:hypothetical protein